MDLFIDKMLSLTAKSNARITAKPLKKKGNLKKNTSITKPVTNAHINGLL